VGNLYKELSRYTKARIHAFVGGTSHIDDIKKFSDGCHIVVGTPGRVIYMLNKKILSLSELKLFIIDKVDEVFERGFSESIKSITGMISDNCKKAIFCSRKDYTDISTIEQVLQMKNVINININTEQPENLLSNLRQYKIKCDDDDKKFETLLTLYQHMEISQVILFCNTKSKCESINEQLNKEGFISSYICDDKDEVIAAFKSGYIRVIITTGDTSSKEIDIYQTSIVINYEMPTSKDEYIKRIGRSESFGKRGIVINFITNKDISLLTEIEQVSPGKVINELPFELSL
jgi:translation initiation factor 4A